MIYDTQGRLVKQVVSGYYSSGRYDFHWQANNYANINVGTGIYFVTMKTDKIFKHEKVLYIR